jgi:hypothetical protein
MSTASLRKYLIEGAHVFSKMEHGVVADSKRTGRTSHWTSGALVSALLLSLFAPASLGICGVPQAPDLTGWKPLIEDFVLPPKSIFSNEMPRYPNLWFYLEESLASSYQHAVRLITENLRLAMQLREIYGPFSNPEGCDFEVRLEHLQPWEVQEHRALQHSHAFHMRYYYSALDKTRLNRVELTTPEGKQSFYRLAASAHYEVEHTNPNHADVEICPVCGRTGEYSQLKGNLVEMVHDPLGLELVLRGTIRGRLVRFEDWKQEEVGSAGRLKDRFSIRQFVFPGSVQDQNTLKVGIAFWRRSRRTARPLRTKDEIVSLPRDAVRRSAVSGADQIGRNPWLQGLRILGLARQAG